MHAYLSYVFDGVRLGVCISTMGWDLASSLKGVRENFVDQILKDLFYEKISILTPKISDDLF